MIPGRMVIMLMLALVCPGLSVAAELVVVAVDAYQKADLTKKHGRWSPYLALSLKPVGQRVEVENRTEFHVFLIDKQGGLNGRTVTFTWRHREDMVLFVQPVKKVVRKIPGHPHAMATYYAWSKPASGSVLLGFAGLRTVYSRAEWNGSRCYGPRRIEVARPDGEIIAQKYFEVHAPGVQLY